MTTAQEIQDRGVKLFQRKDYEEASRAFAQAQSLYETDGKPDMAAEMQVNIALVHRALSEHQQALEIMQTAVRTFQQMNDRKRMAMALGNLGGVYAVMGDHEQAYSSYRTAADIFDEIGEKKLHGETLVAMGALQVKNGKLGAGAASYEVGLSELDNLSPSQRILKGLIGIRNRITGQTND